MTVYERIVNIGSVIIFSVIESIYQNVFYFPLNILTIYSTLNLVICRVSKVVVYDIYIIITYYIISSCLD